MPKPYPVRDTSEVCPRVAKETSGTDVSARPKQLVSREQSWAVRALSWLGDWILEGFAMYGESIRPCLLDFPDDSGRGADASRRSMLASLPSRESPWAQSAQVPRDIDIHAWLASAPPAPRGIQHCGASSGMSSD